MKTYTQEMKTYTQKELNTIIENHQLWLRGEGGEQADLRDAYLYGVNLEGVNLECAYLRGINLRGAYLEGVNLRGAYLERANLRGADLRGINLEQADLRGAYLYGVNLEGVNLECAYLRGANLEGADLRGAYLEGANLRGVYLEGVTGNMREVKSLFLGTYPITYTADAMQIGCECHDIHKWWDFTDEDIISMGDEGALEFWHKYKDFICTAIRISPATPTRAKK